MTGRIMGKGRRIAAILGVTALSGCQSQEPTYSETISLSAGDAIAANTAMQMVNPWPPGVRETNLSTPADLEQYKRRPADGGQNISGGETPTMSPDGTTTQ